MLPADSSHGSLPPPSVRSTPRGSRPAAILLVWNDEEGRADTRRTLERDGHRVTEARRDDALRALFTSRPDLIVVGYERRSDPTDLIARVRDVCDTPLLVVSCSGDEAETVRVLRAGADGCLSNASGGPLLLARVAAITRRLASRAGRAGYFADDLVEIDHANAEARVDGRPLGLTPLELRLLTELAEHSGQVLSAGQLLERVWGESDCTRDRVKIYIGYLRSKFRAQGVEAPITTVRGFGYRYDPRAG